MKPLLNGIVVVSALAVCALSAAARDAPREQPASEATESSQVEASPSETAAQATPEADPEVEDPRLAVVKADQDLAAAVEEGDVEAFAALIAEDAVFLSGAEVLRGRDAVVAGWASLMAPERTAELTWTPSGIRMAGSGELAYTIGGYALTVRPPEGEPVVSEGQYLSVWSLGEDGAWRVVADGPLRRDRAEFLEVALEKQGRLGAGVGAVLAFRPERTALSASGDLSYTLGVYEARRVNLDGTEESLAEGGWLAVWALDPEHPETGLLPGGDAVTPPPPQPPPPSPIAGEAPETAPEG